jgi:hypothetical protein
MLARLAAPLLQYHCSISCSFDDLAVRDTLLFHQTLDGN